MTDLYPYSIESLEEMFNLRKGDIHSLVQTEGVPFYSVLRNDFIGYLPSLGSAFKLDYATEQQVLKNVNPFYMDVHLSEPLISVKTINSRIPSTAYLFNNLWVEEALSHLDINNNDFSLLISKNINAPFFCGHDKPINRLGMNLDGEVVIMKVSRFIKEWK